MTLRQEFEENQNRRSSKLKKGITAVLAAYLTICMPNTIRTIKEMGPVSVEFEKVVYDKPDKIENRILDYGGRIDAVLNKRRFILSKNDCRMIPYFGKWNAGALWKDGKYEYFPTSLRALFCYNPFNKSGVKK